MFVPALLKHPDELGVFKNRVVLSGEKREIFSMIFFFFFGARNMMGPEHCSDRSHK